MKKIAITLSLIALTSLTASDDLRTEIALTAGFNKFDSASTLENSSLFGIRATMYENEVNKYGLQVGYEGAVGVNYENVVGETDLHRLFTHLVVDGEEEYNVIPYLLFGGGYEFLSDEIKGEPSQGFVDLGLGFKYFLNNNFNALLETRAIGKFDTRDLGFNVNVGLGYCFGGKSTSVFEPINAFEPKIIPKIKAPKTTMTMIKAPMHQESNPMDELTAMVNEIDGSTKTASPVAKVDAVSIHDEIPLATTIPVSSDDMAVTSGDYYVQMAALVRTSTQPLVDTLTTNGYGNIVVYPRGDTNLVLVGPYMSRTDAVSAKRGLKSIRSDAFLFHMN